MLRGCVSSLLSVAFVVLLSSTFSSAQSCGYGGISVSTTADLILYTPSYNWTIRPCGVVSTPGYCNAQFCQGTTNVSYYSATGNYAGTGSDNAPLWAYTTYLGQNGIAQIIQDGTDCGGVGARQGTIEFICNSSATTPYFAAVNEPATCHYQAIVYTSAACSITAAAIQQVGSTVISTTCGAGIYNLASLVGSDITFLPGDSSTHYIRVCGVVNSTTLCAGNGPTSVCQVSSGTGYTLAMYEPILYPTVYVYNSNGISQIIQDGQRCGGAEEERLSNITFVCNSAATTPVVTSVTESPQCHYNYIIQTSAVCGSAYAAVSPQATCGFGPYDLTPLTQQDFTLFQTNNSWAIRPCGVVQTPGYCNAQFCQGTTNVSYWNPNGDYSSTGTDNAPLWAYTTYQGMPGVAQIIQDGTDCGGYGSRQGTIEFICNSAATTAYLATVIETVTCHYQAVIMTNLVCGATAAQLQTVGSATISTQCGGGIYDLSALTNQEFNTTETGSNWVNYIYVRLCGTVQSTNLCVLNSTSPAQVCQIDLSGGGAGLTLALYQPYLYPSVWTYNGNGVSQIIQDGTRCGTAEEERLTNITLQCNTAATTAYISSFFESPLCHYNFIVQTNQVCGSPFAAALSLPTTSTSCQYGPYNLNSISGTDLIWYGNGYWWAIRPCGTVSTTGFCAGQFCQGGTTISLWNGTAVANYAATGADNVPIWASVSYGNANGVAQIIQDGTSCGGNVGDRQGAIYFICNQTATTPFIQTVFEGVACHYTAVIQTSVVCGVTAGATQVPGGAFISSQCGGGIYNLTSLAATDILGVVNPVSTDNTLYNYYINICGAVRNTNLCFVNNSVNASVCQVSTNSTYGYPLATWQPTVYPVVWQYNGGSGGVSQIIQNGFSCGGEERLTNLTLVCSPTATTPVFVSAVEAPTCHYTITIQTNAVCGAPFSVAQPAGSCQWGGYDLSSLTGTDLYLTQAGFNWALRPCGTVSNTSYCGAQFCQGSTIVSYYNPTGDYSSTGSDNIPVWAYSLFLGQTGVAQIIQDGADCGGYGARQGTIEFICNATATTPYFAYVIETITCHYQAIVYTNLVCGITTSQLQQVGTVTTTTRCGGAFYDISSITNADINATIGGYNYFIRLCGAVSLTQLCTTNSSASAQVCQVDPTGFGYGYAMSVYQPYAYPTIYQYNGNGISQYIQDGTRCGSAEEERASNITLICTPSATTPVLVSVTESPACHYNIIIQTSAVCGTPFLLTQPAVQSCTFNGVDLSTIASQDLLWYGNDYWWAIRPCGTVSTTGFCAGQFCQALNTVSLWNGTALANYAGTGTDNTPIWAYVTYNGQLGVAQILQDGTTCGGNVGSREGIIYFLCNQAATTPYITNVTEAVNNPCHYTAIIQTSAVCGVTTAQTQTIGASVVSTTCGGGIYNLASLAATDITGTVGPTSSDSTVYNFYINVCGVVRNTNLCALNNSVNASVCQVSTTGFGYGYPLSTYNPTVLPVVYTYNGNGLSQIIQDGFACGGEERLTNITLVCNTSSSTPYLASVVESPTCHYTLTVFTNQVCGAAFSSLPYTASSSTGGTVVTTPSSSAAVSTSTASASTSTGGGSTTSTGAAAATSSSSSSGLSGGAIAGIVIGSLVGAAILVAVCAVLLLGSTRRGRKSHELKEVGTGSGGYGEQMDNSHVEHSQTGYEQNETGVEGAEVEMQ